MTAAFLVAAAAAASMTTVTCVASAIAACLFTAYSMTSAAAAHDVMLPAGARVQMAVHEPADQLLLTIDPLFSATRVSSRIKHTITVLEPATGEP